MWRYTWTLLLVCCTVSAAEVTTTEAATEAPTTPEVTPVATTRAPPRTLDRKAAELAWKHWLQSPESGNNAPSRRITTKSLFITPIVCPKGQQIGRDGCTELLTVNKDEHAQILMQQLNNWFPSNDKYNKEDYDYGEDVGPVQINIPIQDDPLAAPLQGQEPAGQAQNLLLNNINLDKKDEKKENAGSVEAELELLKQQNNLNNNTVANNAEILNHNGLNKDHHSDKPKRDNAAVNATSAENHSSTFPDEGQKEIVYGHVNVDPVLYDMEHSNVDKTQPKPENPTTELQVQINAYIADNSNKVPSPTNNATLPNKPKEEVKTKLNPETDYSDIGEAIKLISRYAEVTTDDNFSKDQKKFDAKEESVLGTRTKLQYRRKPKPEAALNEPKGSSVDVAANGPVHNIYPKNGAYYRYPWPSQHQQTPPPDYPFRHLQDYWPGRQVGGLYNTHENPRRHHHSYPHSSRAHGFQPGLPQYPEQLRGYIHRMLQQHGSRSSNQDLYSLLGLRHWFSSEGTSKR